MQNTAFVHVSRPNSCLIRGRHSLCQPAKPEIMEPIHILMVEDDPGDVFLIKEALGASSLRFTLHHAEHGEQALDFVYQRNSHQSAPRPHLILLDLNLPRISGIEVLRNIKFEPGLRTIPVIVLTTSRSDGDSTLCHQLGASAFISKAASFEGFHEVGKFIENFWLGQAG